MKDNGILPNCVEYARTQEEIERRWKEKHTKGEKKMRLIDAEYLVNLIKAGNYCDDLGQIVHSIGEKEVNEAPTVEAIPIEWIMKTIELADRVKANEYARYLRMLLKDWRIEKWN